MLVGVAWTAAAVIYFSVYWRVVDLHHSDRAVHRAGQAEGSEALTEHDVRWGIVGPGRIAAGVVKDFPHVPGASRWSRWPAGRSSGRRTFATEHGIERAYGSYAEIIADPDVDVLYIATPHPQHHRIALAAIAAGKAVLVEKTFTATVAGAER